MAARRIYLLFALSSTAAAIDAGTLIDPGSAKGYDNGTGSWGLNFTTLNRYLDQPNASTFQRLPDPRTLDPASSKPKPLESWLWYLTVRDDIPVAESTHKTNTSNESHFTASRIRFNAPLENTIPDTVDDWKICLYNWMFNESVAAYPEKLRYDDGTCRTVVDDQCVKDIEAQAVTDYSQGSNCECPDVTKIQSCGQENIFVGDSNHCYVRTFNKTQVEKWHLQSYDLILHASELHAKDDITAYNEIGTLAWPVMALWGSWPLYQETFGSLVNTTAKLTCLRAQNASYGSPMPKFSAGNRNGLGRFLGVCLLLAVIAFVL